MNIKKLPFLNFSIGNKKILFLFIFIIVSLLFEGVHAEDLDNCNPEPRFYWITNEGCMFFYGNSIWADEINELSNNYQGYFGDINGSVICRKLWFFSVNRRGLAEGSVLNLYLNIVSGRLQLDALIAGAVDQEEDSFTRLGLRYNSEINEAVAKIEEILANEFSTNEQLDDVGNVAQRMQYFYGIENPRNPECIYGYFGLELNQGWNLISIPLLLEIKTVESIFEGISYSKIFTYANEQWHELDNNSLINGTKGYWVNSLESQTLTIEGTKFSYPVDIPLKQGWNLIGYPSLNANLINETLEDIDYSVVYAYDGLWSSYVPDRAFNSLETMEPGYGYLIDSNEDTILTVT